MLLLLLSLLLLLLSSTLVANHLISHYRLCPPVLHARRAEHAVPASFGGHAAPVSFMFMHCYAVFVLCSIFVDSISLLLSHKKCIISFNAEVKQALKQDDQKTQPHFAGQHKQISNTTKQQQI